MLTPCLRRWPGIETALGDCPVCGWTAMRVTLLSPVARKATTQITRYIGTMLMSVTLGQHYYNYIPLSPKHVKAYIREYFFLSTF